MPFDSNKTKHALLEELEAARRTIAEQAKILDGIKYFSREMESLGMVGGWELDFRSNQLWWSEGIYTILEVDSENFAASHEIFLDTTHPEDRERVNLAYLSSIETRSPYDIEHRLLLPDGRF